jgi:hypothetical protein
MIGRLILAVLLLAANLDYSDLFPPDEGEWTIQVNKA